MGALPPPTDARAEGPEPRFVSPGPRPAWRERVAPIASVARRVGACLEAAVLVGAMAWTAGELHGQWQRELDRATPIHGVSVEGASVGGLETDALAAVVSAAALASLDRPLTLVAGDQEVVTTARALGATAVWEPIVDETRLVGRSGQILVDLSTRIRARREGIDLGTRYRFEEDRAFEHVQSIAPRVERPSLPTRLDLVHRKVIPAERGVALLAYDSMSAVAIGLASGSDRIDLVLQAKPPVDDPLAEIADQLDISMVLGSFDTPYRTDPGERDRNHNLKVGAAALDGHVVLPGETFSFNDVVGERSAENGYRFAMGITSGELVDVLGGGICQVSSTLFGAAFFSGIDIVSARPHSRPSTYVDMGLDSTVVWPSVDLKLHNSYDFPVVLHMTVSLGKVRAEVLGPRRPYQVAFERTLQEVKPYSTIWRDDPRLRSGHQAVAQHGKRGFELLRTRKIMQGGEVVREESWELQYPPTTEILRRGTNPAGEVPEKVDPPPVRDPAPSLRIVQ
jgi:vancomycin resistance protein YoaR